MTHAVGPPTAVPRAGPREWIGLAVLALPTLLISMDVTVLYLAVPQLSADLAPSSAELLWILDIYGFLVAGFLIAMGTLGDRIGRRRLLLIGAAAFGIASLIAAWSTSAEMLIANRALLGIAGATLMPSTLALIRNMFHHPTQRTTAIAVWSSSFIVGMTLGPLVGGSVLEHFWWGSVFLLGVPPMVLLLLLGRVLLPEYRDPNPGRLDLVSVLLSVVAMLGLVYGVKELAKEGFAPEPLLALALGLLVGYVFVHRQRRLADPLLDLRLFSNRKFSASLMALTLTLFAMSGLFFFLSQYMQLVLGLSPFEAGLWTLPQAGAMVVASGLTPALARVLKPATLMSGALVVAAVGFLLFTGLDGSDDLGLMAVGTVVFALGVSPMSIMGVDMIVGTAPPERAGAASAISETNQEFGMAVGVAVLGTVGTAIYRSGLSDSMPAGVPDAAAGVAQDTLGGALEVADRLPGDTGAALVAAARAAFVDGLRVNAVIGAGLVLAAGALVVLMLRHVAPVDADAAVEAARSASGDSGPGAGSPDTDTGPAPGADGGAASEEDPVPVRSPV